MAIPKKGEYKKSSTATKEVFYYSDEKEGVDVLSREVYKKKPLEIHYPFDRKGGPKYKFIESIEYRGISPSKVSGVFTAATFGLGFTKNTAPVLYQLERFPRIKKVVVSATLPSKIENTQIVFNTTDLTEIFNRIKPLRGAQYEQLKKAANNALSAIYPQRISYEKENYVKGNLGLFIKSKKITSDKLSNEDVGELIKILPERIAEEALLYQAEEKINFIKLKSIKTKFKKLVDQKHDTKNLEERCQKFFTQNSWIFSNILSTPVALLRGKAYVGGKTYENANGKIADFLYRNRLTKNVFVIEIKTPTKKLIDTKVPYRKPDVFSIGKELSGGLVQLLDQKDTLEKNFSIVADGEYHSFNPKTLLVIGRLSDLKNEQVKSFELFRSSLKDTEIMTYDELLERTDLILGQFVDDKPKPKPVKKSEKKKI